MRTAESSENNCSEQGNLPRKSEKAGESPRVKGKPFLIGTPGAALAGVPGFLRVPMDGCCNFTTTATPLPTVFSGELHELHLSPLSYTRAFASLHCLIYQMKPPPPIGPPLTGSPPLTGFPPP